MPFYLSNWFQPAWRWSLQKTQYFVALLPAPAVNRDYRSLGALPAVHMRCCPLYFASCFAFPWDISGEFVARRAVPDSHVLAVAPPEVPVVVCMGCFLHTAEASSSPSDPLGLKAAKQVVTHDVHPVTERNCSQLPKNPSRKLQQAGAEKQKLICLFSGAKPHSYTLNYSRIPAALSNLQTFHKEQTRWEEVILCWYISRGQRTGKKGERIIKKDELWVWVGFPHSR